MTDYSNQIDQIKKAKSFEEIWGVGHQFSAKTTSEGCIRNISRKDFVEPEPGCSSIPEPSSKKVKTTQTADNNNAICVKFIFAY